MKTHLDCIPCTVSSFMRLLDNGVIPQEKQEILMRKVLDFLSKTDYSHSPPEMGAELHRMIRDILQDKDPYRQIKEKYNVMMMELYPKLKDMLEESGAPLDTAMRLAIGGNVIDFGAKYQFDVMETIQGALDRKPDPDDSGELLKALGQARKVMYIGDNCGEIVLDKLFLEYMDVDEKIFVVREKPIINDVTEEDARMVGMDQVARVKTTGDDSPGAVWERSSGEFRKLFTEADVVISKGQGNLEGLIEVKHDQLYFLLVTKCELIAERIGSRKGQFVVMKAQ